MCRLYVSVNTFVSQATIIHMHFISTLIIINSLSPYHKESRLQVLASLANEKSKLHFKYIVDLLNFLR